MVKIVNVKQSVFEENNKIAHRNKEFFDSFNLFVLNLMSAPGGGKTSIIERTIDALRGKYKIGVIEGDITSSIDAEKLEMKGVPAIQLNTGGECHLDANMVSQAIENFDFNGLHLVIIENVGNLVCPAEFKVGEDMKVMILSAPEGHDKPKKYPLMFIESSALIINKIDLLPYIDTDIDLLIKNAKEINPNLKIFKTSARTGEGIQEWTEWLSENIETKRKKI
ncbi:MAG: hydrogenase nickel incorporation protein HypB [Candidatus Aminicenantia bacterium]